ncbi:hypothetical protein [Kineosporia sp. NBRC 101731]|uniref:hypothetical protein n=1 Tax=Kineosporia sp. NBRC 101731 TaxID=3032199 RepID=UPI0024A335D5|nr:hypothetical protein [Kineosporia sp. NBRC 101731]GLY26805.1 hypothetical protein Kisp02_01700 [Kineosporia sp. NBRC 101731]
MGTLEQIVYTGIMISGAIAMGQIAWLGTDKVIGKLGTEPRHWLENKLRSEN